MYPVSILERADHVATKIVHSDRAVARLGTRQVHDVNAANPPRLSEAHQLIYEICEMFPNSFPSLLLMSRSKLENL